MQLYVLMFLVFFVYSIYSNLMFILFLSNIAIHSEICSSDISAYSCIGLLMILFISVSSEWRSFYNCFLSFTNHLVIVLFDKMCTSFLAFINKYWFELSFYIFYTFVHITNLSIYFVHSFTCFVRLKFWLLFSFTTVILCCLLVIK